MPCVRGPKTLIQTKTHGIRCFSYSKRPATLLQKENGLVQHYLLLTNPPADSLSSGTYMQLDGHSTPTEKVEPGGIKCDYKKAKLLCGQMISRFKKAL